MALKGDRKVESEEIGYFLDATAERGVVCAKASTSGSGVALDQSVRAVQVAADPSGLKPIGVLMNDVVNLNLTRQKLNPYKDEVQKGGKVTFLKLLV